MPWTLVKADEFDGPAGSVPNSALWKLSNFAPGSWAPTEVQVYKPANVALDGNGHLAITAKREVSGSWQYTSGRLQTNGLFEQTYGAWEGRIKMPQGNGFWPGFWLGSYYQYPWPQGGEIDLFESWGNASYATATYITGSHSGLPRFQATIDFSQFHVYGVEWEPTVLRFFVDGLLIGTVLKSQVGDWPFDHPFFIVLNFALTNGGEPGAVDASTPLPATMLVDYVRVYQGSADPVPIPPPTPPPTGGQSMNGIDTVARGSGWSSDGNGLYANSPSWVEYPANPGSYTLTIVARNHGSLPPPTGFVYNLRLEAGGTVGNLSIPASTTDQSGVTQVTIPAGQSRLRLVWTNDSYTPGVSDANLMIQTVALTPAGGTPPPAPLPPPAPSDARTRASTKLKALGFLDDEVNVIVNL